MCWKYEDKYGKCFDHIEWENDSDTIRGVLEGQFNVEIMDSRAYIVEMYAMLSKLHESGAIRPKETVKEDTVTIEGDKIAIFNITGLPGYPTIEELDNALKHKKEEKNETI